MFSPLLTVLEGPLSLDCTQGSSADHPSHLSYVSTMQVNRQHLAQFPVSGKTSPSSFDSPEAESCLVPAALLRVLDGK